MELSPLAAQRVGDRVDLIKPFLNLWRSTDQLPRVGYPVVSLGCLTCHYALSLLERRQV